MEQEREKLLIWMAKNDYAPSPDKWNKWNVSGKLLTSEEIIELFKEETK